MTTKRVATAIGASGALAAVLMLAPSNALPRPVLAATGCGIPNIAVAVTSVAPGSFNPASTSLAQCISSAAAQLNQNSARPGVYNVKRAPYGARCDGTSDDVRAIQRAEQAAAAAGGGTVYLPPGRCVISTGIAWDSNVNLIGAGMFRSTLVASVNFGFDPSRVRRGPDGRYIGMLWLDGPTQSAPLRHVTVSDLGFDPRAGTQGMKYGEFNYEAVASYMRALQDVRFDRLYFNLGYNTRSYIGVSDGPKGFTGFTLKLATDCDNPSSNVSFTNIVGHNGYGTIQLYASDPPSLRCSDTTKLSQVRIDGVADFIDGQYIDDDRVVMDGSNVATSLTSDVSIRNIETFVFDGTTGGINSIKVNPGNKGTIRGVNIYNVRYRGPSTGRYPPPLNLHHAVGSGSPIAILANTKDGAVNDVTVDTIYGTNSMGIPVHVRPTPLSGETAKLSINNVRLLHCYDVGAAFIAGFWSDPTGQDNVQISNLTLQAAPEALAQNPQVIGLLMRGGHSPSNGVSGNVTVSNVSIQRYPIPLSIAGGPAFRNATLVHIRADTGRFRVPAGVQWIP